MFSKHIAIIVLMTGVYSFAETKTIPHVNVKYEGVDEKWATAIAETMAAARQVYLDEFGSDMPDTVYGTITCKAGETTRLFTDGKDHLNLSIPSQDKLAKPSQSGVFNLYGMCHELGHMAMYRTLKNRDWMTSAAAEGWAHYAGSVVVDHVYAAKGESLWPDRYDYRQDGTARLKKQLESKSPNDVGKGAEQWQKLGAILGAKGYAKLFAAWQTADVDVANPSDTLIKTAVKLDPDQKDALTEWWKTAGPLFTAKREASAYKAETIPAAKLSGKPTKLSFDDNSSEGKKSIAGGGHARKFSTPDDSAWYLRNVSVHGARYGRPTQDKFDVALCDEDLKPITVWQKPYSTFKTGSQNWTRIDIPPTRVPKTFYICLNFRPTQTQGVYVSYDESTKGNSLVGTPGDPGKGMAQGDWMIRVELDRPATPASASK